MSAVSHNSLKAILLVLLWGMGFPASLIADRSVAPLPESIRVEGLKMILVNPGSFTMGTAGMPPRAEPYEGLRKVTISKAFYLAETETAQAMWNRHMKINPSRFTSPSLPIEGITWQEAMEFCKKLNQIENTPSIPKGMVFRLPSEAEWEYAARAGSNTTFFFGDNSEFLTKYAWISDNAEGSTKSIGLLEPNKWGFLDIYGNVREWCLDGYGARPSEKLVDPMLGWANMDKVNRGGSWDSCEACCETAKRMNYGENYQSSDIGFRLAIGYPFPQMIEK